MGDWLTRNEAAELLKVHPATVSNIVREMEERGFEGVWRDGSHFVRIHRESLERYLFKRRQIKRQEKWGAL